MSFMSITKVFERDLQIPTWEVSFINLSHMSL